MAAGGSTAWHDFAKGILIMLKAGSKACVSSISSLEYVVNAVRPSMLAFEA